MAYALRSCLTKLPLNIVNNVNDDLDEKQKRLDEKYDRTSELADNVVFDIKRLWAVKEGKTEPGQGLYKAKVNKIHQRSCKTMPGKYMQNWKFPQ